MKNSKLNKTGAGPARPKKQQKRTGAVKTGRGQQKKAGAVKTGRCQQQKAAYACNFPLPGLIFYSREERIC